MSFRIASDLHLEFYTKYYQQLYKNNTINNIQFTNLFNSLQQNKPVDYLILAGDITSRSSIDNFNYFLKSICPTYKKVFYVLGNHEFYYEDKTHRGHLYDNANYYKNAVLKDVDNLVFLDNEEYTLEHVNTLNDIKTIKIFGSTLWSNVTKEAFELMNDYNFVDLPDVLRKHNETLDFLKDKDSEYDIIITHHMPSKSLIDEKYKKNTYGSLNSGFASDCEHVFKALKENRYWIYGHTHTRKISQINNRNFICNPLGYPSESVEYIKDFNTYDITFDLDLDLD
jgi:DNA repair exonuclease SbcCD nuclease subunit